MFDGLWRGLYGRFNCAKSSVGDLGWMLIFLSFLVRGPEGKRGVGRQIRSE